MPVSVVKKQKISQSQSAPTAYEKLGLPVRSTKPLTEPQEFSFSTARRAAGKKKCESRRSSIHKMILRSASKPSSSVSWVFVICVTLLSQVLLIRVL